MLGDGHVSRFQTAVSLGTKEYRYAEYVADLMHHLFATQPSIFISKKGYRTVCLSSSIIANWFIQEGLVPNKVAAQVDSPAWIRSFIRGFFDTDGSIYRLRFGRQIEFTNHSLPLLNSLQGMLITLGYKPSTVCGNRVYVTRRSDVDRFFAEIRPANAKHVERFLYFSRT